MGCADLGPVPDPSNPCPVCCLVFFFFVFFCLFRVTPVAFGDSQARGPIRAAATSLCHNHSNVGLKLHLQPTPQLTAAPDP